MRSPFTRSDTRHLPHVTLQPSLPRRSAAKAGPTQSNHTYWGGDSLSPQPSRCPPGVHGPRLWQSPAAALRPCCTRTIPTTARATHSSFCWQAELRLRHSPGISPSQSKSVQPSMAMPPPPGPPRLHGQICVSSVLRGRRSALWLKPKFHSLDEPAYL